MAAMICAGLLGAAPAAFQQTPQRGACFFTSPNFKGQRFCLSSNDSASSMPLGFNDTISSVQVFGNATATVYEHEGFAGQSIQISTDQLNLTNSRSPNGFRWNKVISSVRVQGGGGRGRGEGGGAGGETIPRRGVCFFKGTGFDGARYCLSSGASAAQMPLGFNDTIESVQVYGGASVTVYEHENFGGQSVTIATGVRNLASSRSPNGFVWNKVISSARVN
jgi:hypothetical protein